MFAIAHNSRARNTENNKGNYDVKSVEEVIIFPALHYVINSLQSKQSEHTASVAINFFALLKLSFVCDSISYMLS